MLSTKNISFGERTDFFTSNPPLASLLASRQMTPWKPAPFNAEIGTARLAARSGAAAPKFTSGCCWSAQRSSEHGGRFAVVVLSAFLAFAFFFFFLLSSSSQFPHRLVWLSAREGGGERESPPKAMAADRSVRSGPAGAAAGGELPPQRMQRGWSPARAARPGSPARPPPPAPAHPTRAALAIDRGRDLSRGASRK